MTSHSKDIETYASIEGRIFMIRGQKVMLDRNLASLYGVETRALNQAVKRNIERFPEDFMFVLSREEIARISQPVTSSGKLVRLKFSKSVTAFTEHGVAMLSSVLTSQRAIQVNIHIMRAFGQLREAAANYRSVAQRLTEVESRLGAHDSELRAIVNALKALMASPAKKRKPIGFRIKERTAPYRKGRKATPA